ncbi:MAG: type 1 glutamine amidotransferase [Leptospirillia bacterium]
MNKILVLQQVPHEGLGRLYALMRRAGATEEVVPCHLPDADIPDTLSGYRALVVLGGPMSANDAGENPSIDRQLELIKKAVAQDFPTLGICLGAQLIAAALGARVFKGETSEIGWFETHLSLESASDPVFAGLPNPLPVFQWHGEGFDLPLGAVHLASSPAFPHQAFRMGNNVYALQFHVEMEESMVKEWVTIGADELAALGDTVDPEAITEGAGAGCELLDETVRTIVTRWLSLSAARS